MTAELDRLDRLAAEKIMGWSYTIAQIKAAAASRVDIEKHCWPDSSETPETWQPTRNIAQAWELLEQLKAEDYCISISSCTDGSWTADLAGGDSRVYAPTAPEAITRACLKAKGLKDEL